MEFVLETRVPDVGMVFASLTAGVLVFFAAALALRLSAASRGQAPMNDASRIAQLLRATEISTKSLPQVRFSSRPYSGHTY